MKLYFILLDFLKYAIPLKVAFSRNIVAKMTANPLFPTPDILLVNLISMIDALENGYIDAQRSGEKETALMHRLEEAWDHDMRIMARYVERAADYDKIAILSSGFNLTKEHDPIQKVELSAKNGEMSGTVLLRRQAVAKATAYIWEYCFGVLAPTDAGWTSARTTSQASVLLEDLNSATRYWFRVAYVTPEGTSEYSDPIMHVVA